MSIYKTKMVNGKEVELTVDEISDLEKRDKEWEDGEYDVLWLVFVKKELIY